MNQVFATIITALILVACSGGQSHLVGIRDKNGWTRLHTAVVQSRYSTMKSFPKKLARIKQLIREGEDVDAKSNTGATPLMFAGNQPWEVTEVLVKAGADVNAKSHEGTTPMGALMSSPSKCNNGFIRKAQLLLKAGAKIDETIANRVEKRCGEQSVLTPLLRKATQ